PLQVVLLGRSAPHDRRDSVSVRPRCRVLHQGAATQVPRTPGQQVTQTQTAAPPEPVDWDLAERVARRFAGREPIAASYLGGSLDSDFSALTTQAEQLVGDFAGLHAPGSASAGVLYRAQEAPAHLRS